METTLLIPLFQRYHAMLQMAEVTFPDKEQCGKAHLIHLCNMAVGGIMDKTMPYGKLCRWLGFIQGILCVSGVTTTQAERDFTRPIFGGES